MRGMKCWLSHLRYSNKRELPCCTKFRPTNANTTAAKSSNFRRFVSSQFSRIWTKDFSSNDVHLRRENQDQSSSQQRRELSTGGAESPPPLRLFELEANDRQANQTFFRDFIRVALELIKRLNYLPVISQIRETTIPPSRQTPPPPTVLRRSIGRLKRRLRCRRNFFFTVSHLEIGPRRNATKTWRKKTENDDGCVSDELLSLARASRE